MWYRAGLGNVSVQLDTKSYSQKRRRAALARAGRQQLQRIRLSPDFDASRRSRDC